MIKNSLFALVLTANSWGMATEPLEALRHQREFLNPILEPILDIRDMSGSMLTDINQRNNEVIDTINSQYAQVTTGIIQLREAVDSGAIFIADSARREAYSDRVNTLQNLIEINRGIIVNNPFATNGNISDNINAQLHAIGQIIHEVNELDRIMRHI